MLKPDSLVGNWRLRQFRREAPDGTVTLPLGPHPLGLLTYAQDGTMSVHLAAPHGEAVRGMDAYTAYYGTYSVIGDGDVVRHHVEAATVKGLAETMLDRQLNLEGDQLELSALLSDARTTLTWERR